MSTPPAASSSGSPSPAGTAPRTAQLTSLPDKEAQPESACAAAEPAPAGTAPDAPATAGDPAPPGGSAAPAPAARHIEQAVRLARAAFDDGRTRPLPWRRTQIEAVLGMVSENAADIESALNADLGKDGLESHLTEVLAVAAEARLLLRNLRRWTHDQPVRLPATFAPGRARVVREPLGVVLVIGAWNYPVNVTLMPLLGALAAGNSVVLKPSELAPACSGLLARLIPRYLDPEAVQVVTGGPGETTELLRHRFDHILYTGNGTVGAIVMAAAARHLTPVTLELGGKSPVWVDESVPVRKAARSIAWGKFTNAGQTCIAPDYVLTTPALAERLAGEVARAALSYYGRDPQRSGSYGRIVNERHTRRLAGLLGSGHVASGGMVDLADRYISPTVLLDVAPDSPVMSEEIFGPILPILTVADHHEAIEFITARPKPLALYAFTSRAAVKEDLLARTSSGSVAFNSVMTQAAVSSLPFGGVGASGIGAYHGEHSIRTFSHDRAVLDKPARFDVSALARPPYTFLKERLLRRL